MRSPLGGALLQEREQVAAAVLGVDDGLARLGDVVVGSLPDEAQVRDEFAVAGDADGRAQQAGAQPLGDRGGVVDPGGVVGVAVAAPHEAGEALGLLGTEEPDLDPGFVVCVSVQSVIPRREGAQQLQWTPSYTFVIPPGGTPGGPRDEPTTAQDRRHGVPGRLGPVRGVPNVPGRR